MRTRTVLMAAALVATLVAAGPATGTERIDVNAASIEQLEALPGIGEVRAAAIVAERAHAPFRSVDELARVEGIGERLLASLREQVVVTPEGK